jgi:hypothetical protein
MANRSERLTGCLPVARADLSKLSDAELMALYKKLLLSDADVGRAPHPWVTVGRVAAVAFGVPLVVLILGASLVWAFSGFAATRS